MVFRAAWFGGRLRLMVTWFLVAWFGSILCGASGRWPRGAFPGQATPAPRAGKLRPSSTSTQNRPEAVVSGGVLANFWFAVELSRNVGVVLGVVGWWEWVVGVARFGGGVVGRWLGGAVVGWCGRPAGRWRGGPAGGVRLGGGWVVRRSGGLGSGWVGSGWAEVGRGGGPRWGDRGGPRGAGPDWGGWPVCGSVARWGGGLVGRWGWLVGVWVCGPWVVSIDGVWWCSCGRVGWSSAGCRRRRR
ncbi:hypothetical protein BCF44_12030 [Kutzneria buriramensis]|uniref:Uncharacterized protein n=1 Tax=Kutzneria buriramensis TaxID=1045776 RepID=A0A3E0GXX8_9PSEU|nr:hypothetical protein BCF44_12030 [Kutzneria buriramensis]